MSDVKPPETSHSGSFIEKASTHDSGSIDVVHGELKSLDVGLALVADRSEDADLSPQESKRLRRKIDWHLLPMLFLIYTVQFLDKGTLASSSILGFIADNHLTSSQFNTLSSAFYIGYLVFEWPQNWALQRFPVGRWLTFNIFLWCLFIGLHAVCHNFGGLFVLRFLLGASEGSMTAGLMLVCSMFYTRTEIGERLGWTFQCNGLAVIISGFLQFGIAHTSPSLKPQQWQWLMLTTALITFIPFLLFLFFFPNNPTNAWFLSEEERIRAVKRVRENQNGIETKVWKRYQAAEAIKDPKTWVMAFMAGFTAMIGGVGVQYALIIKNFGFTQLQTALLGIPGGVAQIIAILLGCYALRRLPNSRAWISIISWIPSILGCLIEICVPIENRVAHLVGIYLLFSGGSPAFIMSMSWVTSAVSGHTKKTTTAALFLTFYALGQTLSTQFWLSKYAPRDRTPFGITLMSHLASILCTLLFRFLLVRENRRRDRMREDARRSGVGVGVGRFEEWAWVETVDGDHGSVRRRKVDKTYLDLTDGENLSFRYVL